MRYIPQLTSETIVQVPEDKNAYINVRNIGASGRGDLEFTGTVTDITNNIVTIGNIADGQGGSIYQYGDLLKTDAELQVFGYSTNTALESSDLTVSNQEIVGSIDFSDSQAVNPNLATLTYYIFAYNADTGYLPSYLETRQIGTKIIDPDQWNNSQYVRLTLSRTSQSVLPVIYRVWGNRVDFLGVIGNNKVGYPGSASVSFSDLGDTEISSWQTDAELPSFMSDVFSVGGGQVSLIKKITAKESLKIMPIPQGSQPSYIQCTGISAGSGLQNGDSVRFRIDDTQYIRLAISTAAVGSIKEVFLPAGVYNIRDSFFINSGQTDYSNIALRGVGDGSVLRRLPSTTSNSSNPGLLNFTGLSQDPRVSGIRIRSVALDGNSGNTFSLVSPIESEVALKVRYADNVVISDCTVVNCGGGGIEVQDSTGVSINTSKVVRTGRRYEQEVSPLLVDTSENLVVQGNIFEFATSGPKIVSTDYSTINGNIVRGCGDQGFELETSFQWNAQGNLAYSDNDSIIRSIDTYNNEYSRATIEVRKGFSLDPIFMTVTYGGESVGIAKGSIEADIYQLNASGVKTGSAVGSFRPLETLDQLEAGIFSLTLPGGTTNQTVDAKTIIATGNLDNTDGYMYEVKADVLIGSFRPLSIRPETIGSTNYYAIRLRNSSDILGFQIYSETNATLNDGVTIRGFDNQNLTGLDPNAYYTIVNIDTASNSILISPISGLTLTDEVEFIGGTLSILRPDYFVADGNLYVHSF